MVQCCLLAACLFTPAANTFEATAAAGRCEQQVSQSSEEKKEKKKENPGEVFPNSSKPSRSAPCAGLVYPPQNKTKRAASQSRSGAVLSPNYSISAGRSGGL